MLVVLSSAVALAYNWQSAKSLPWVAVEKTFETADISALLAETPAGVPAAEAGEAPKEIHLEQAWALYQSGRAVFVDARTAEEYAGRHIKGAVNIPWENWADYSHELPGLEGRPVVTYCSGRECKSSVHLAEQLAEMGFSPLFIFFGGWPEWEKAGYPMEP